MLSANELRNGTVFKYEEKTWIVLKYEFTKTGRGSGTVKVKARDVRGNSIVEKGFNLNQKFEEASIEKKSGTYLYNDGSEYYFMENDTCEQLNVSEESIEGIKYYLLEGEKVILIFLDDELLTVECPKSINLKVVYSEPAVKGDSTSNPQKQAEMETGLKIMVPLFINSGDTIKIDTQNGTYVQKVN